MSLPNLDELATQGMRLYALNNDPLTLDAAKILLKAGGSVSTQPQRNAYILLTRQVEAYTALYTNPLT